MTLPLASPFTDYTFTNKAQLDQLVTAINTLYSNFQQQSYTPTLGGTSAAPTNWSTSGVFQQIGKTVVFEATFTVGTGHTDGSGVFTFGLPVPAAQNQILPVGQGVITNNNYHYVAQIISTVGASACCLFQPGTQNAVGSGGALYGTSGWGVGNLLRIAGTYRAA